VNAKSKVRVDYRTGIRAYRERSIDALADVGTLFLWMGSEAKQGIKQVGRVEPACYAVWYANYIIPITQRIPY